MPHFIQKNKVFLLRSAFLKEWIIAKKQRSGVGGGYHPLRYFNVLLVPHIDFALFDFYQCIILNERNLENIKKVLRPDANLKAVSYRLEDSGLRVWKQAGSHPKLSKQHAVQFAENLRKMGFFGSGFLPISQ